MNKYQIGGAGAVTLHTGADLNLNVPVWNNDWHQPIYAMSWGYVVYVGVGGGSWGRILVTWHWDYLDGQPFYCRIGHLENPRVVTGQMVSPGQIVAYVGNGDGYYGSTGAHCHWDICTTDLLESIPNEWPGMNAALLLANYTAPIPFVIKRKQQMVTNPDTTTAYYALLDSLPDDAPVTVIPGVPDPRDPTQEVTAFTLTVVDMRRTPAPPAPDPTPQPPADAIPMVSTDNVRVRSQATTSSAQVVVNGVAAWVSKGTEATIKDIGIVANGYHWGQLYSPYQGFVALEFFVKKA